MNPDLKCRRVTVNLNRVEVDALVEYLGRGCPAAQAKCARNTILKVVDAWRVEAATTQTKNNQQED